MTQIEKLLESIKANPKNVRFSDLVKICNQYFGEPRQQGTSHKIYKMPWKGDPRVNIQKGKNGEAKTYQVKQVIAAIDKIGRTEKMVNYEHYTYRVLWSEDDKEYAGLCAEFPSLSHLDKNHIDAMQGILNLVKEVVTDMQANGETIPVPLSEKHFSGKFQVRIPPEQHRNLAVIASEQGVSLNRYISAKLSE